MMYLRCLSKCIERIPCFDVVVVSCCRFYFLRIVLADVGCSSARQHKYSTSAPLSAIQQWLSKAMQGRVHLLRTLADVGIASMYAQGGFSNSTISTFMRPPRAGMYTNRSASMSQYEKNQYQKYSWNKVLSYR